MCPCQQLQPFTSTEKVRKWGQKPFTLLASAHEEAWGIRKVMILWGNIVLSEWLLKLKGQSINGWLRQLGNSQGNGGNAITLCARVRVQALFSTGIHKSFIINENALCSRENMLNTGPGPGKQQKQISPNHVQILFWSSVQTCNYLSVIRIPSCDWLHSARCRQTQREMRKKGVFPALPPGSAWIVLLSFVLANEWKDIQILAPQLRIQLSSNRSTGIVGTYVRTTDGYLRECRSWKFISSLCVCISYETKPQYP